jgi:hypothetical protein
MTAALGLGLCTGVFAASDLDDPSDFAQIAKNGFALTVDGAFFSDPDKTVFPALTPDEGDPRNSYAWGNAWYDGALWIGTNRDVLCSNAILAAAESFLGFPLIEVCPPAAEGLPGLPAADQRPEIWRYTPSSLDAAGDWGLGGVWERVFVSPSLSNLIIRLGDLPPDTPRDVGYRTMEVCDAGDGTERLYVATVGIPGRILYHDGETFVSASTSGLSTRLRDLSSGEYDLGFRAMACFKGRLWISPAGVFGDIDIARNPVVYMNPYPSAGGTWEPMVDVSDPAAHPLADAGNLGIFQFQVMGDYLYLTTFNRESGFEVWRGDGSDCLAPWEGDGRCTMDWVKVIDHGAGRPADLPGPEIDNAGAVLGVLDGDLYVGAGESGGNRVTLAEMLRIRDAAVPPAADPAVPHEWELLVGWPRRDHADPAQRLPGLENLDCRTPGDSPGTAPGSWLGLPITELDADTLADDCLPSAMSGPGLAINSTNPLEIGSTSYFWRFTEHQDELFVGTLDALGAILPTGELGFDLLRTADGVQFTQITEDGFGNRWNYGLRTLLSVPDLGLVVGSANPFTLAEDEDGNPAGGTEIFIGTTAPGPFVPPAARADAEALIFDYNQDGVVEASLRGEGSSDPFGGSGIVGYEWYRGALAADCGNLTNLHGGALVSTEVNPTLELAALEGGQDRVTHRFTLRVSDGAGGYGCDEVEVTASHNLPPTLEVDPSVPEDDGAVVLVDFDGDGSEAYPVTVLCADPEGAVTRCEISPASSGAAVSAVTHPDCASLGHPGAEACLQAQVSGASSDSLGSAAVSEVLVEVEDAAGYTARYRLRTLVQPVIDTAETDDPPVCRSQAFQTLRNLALQIVPGGTDMLCVDPEGASPLAVHVVSAPDHGDLDLTRTGRLVYQPDRDYLGEDRIRLKVDDGSWRSERTVTLLIEMVDDPGPPDVTIDFAEDATTYFDRSFRVGCGTEGVNDVCGTAGDGLSGISQVGVSLEREHNGTLKYWNALSGEFDLDVPYYFRALVMDDGSWHRDLGAALADGSYTLRARALDGALNEAYAEVVFTKASDGVPPQVSIGFPAPGGSYSASELEAGCAAGPGVCGTAADALSGVGLVEAAIQRRSDGAWWTGSGFSAVPGPLWLRANGTTDWHLPFPAPAPGDYAVRARATDQDDNAASTDLDFTRVEEAGGGLLARLLAFFGRFF